MLLDTNALLWLLDGDDRLGPRAHRAVTGAERLVVSVVSLWEVAIKVSIGKILPISGFYDTVGRSGLDRLDIAGGHLRTLETLPPIHRDPFDRLLISQALAEGLTVLTADDAFASYGVVVVDARG